MKSLYITHKRRQLFNCIYINTFRLTSWSLSAYVTYYGKIVTMDTVLMATVKRLEAVSI